MKRLESTLLSGSSGCVLSECEQYRLQLWRTWDSGRELCVVMLNPSTADHTVNDATARTLLRLAPGWGFTGLRVVNLFALRATDPRELRKAADPVGPDNDVWIDDAARQAAGILVAWGSHGSYRDRARAVLAGPLAGRALHCLGVTDSGQPRHPLYSRSDAKLEEYRP